MLPCLDQGLILVQVHGGEQQLTVMSPLKDHKINYCSTHLLTLAEIFELGFQT